MEPHRENRVQAEGLVVRIHGTRLLALAPPEHLNWHRGQPAPVHEGDEPWLLRLGSTPPLSEGELVRCRGWWGDDAFQVAEALEIPYASEASLVGGLASPPGDEEEFDPKGFPEFTMREWTDLESSLLAQGFIAGRAYMRGDVIRYSVDDVHAMTPILSALHPRVEIVRCIAAKDERDLAASIGEVATAAGVLCAIGNSTNLRDPSQPLFAFEVARVTAEISDVIASVPPAIVRVSAHLTNIIA